MNIQNEIDNIKSILGSILKELSVLTGKEKAPLLEAHDRVIIEFKQKMDAKEAEVENVLATKEALSSDLPQIAVLLQDGDIAGANRLLHAIKGFIPIFCQEPLCQEVSNVEGMSKEPADVGLSQAYTLLRPHLEHLLVEVSTYLARGNPDA